MSDMIDRRIPTEAFHISKFIQDEIDARGWTIAQVAMRMGGFAEDLLTLSLIMDVHDKYILLGEETAEALGRAFGISAEYFINLDKACRVRAHELATDSAAPDPKVRQNTSDVAP